MMSESRGTKRRRTRREQEDVRVGKWSVERRLAISRVEGRAAAHMAAECGGQCCRHGVYIALSERDRILEHAEQVQAAMDATQTTDTDLWFEDELHEDADFPGGVCVGTEVHNDKCVFLNREGLCVLQQVEPEVDLAEDERLKPFYCRLFPISTCEGRLEFDDLCNGVRPCCTIASAGRTRTLDAYAYEFREVLGDEGYEELLRRVEGLQGSQDGSAPDRPERPGSS